MNKRRRYKGFNKRGKTASIRVFTLILCLSLVGGYGYIELKNSKLFNDDFNLSKSISEKIKNISISNIFKIGKSKENEEYVYDDISDELNNINNDAKVEETSSENDTSQVQVATIDAVKVYTVQVASIGENQDLDSVEDKLKNNKIPYSVVEVDGVEKVQTYSSFDESVTRSNLESARKVYSDAFISELEVPVLSLEYTDKYSYIEDISTELNNLIASFKDEAEFWEKSTDSIDLEAYNNILTKRLDVVEKIQENAEKIDYSQMDTFKENLIEYAKSVNSNTTQASKDAKENNGYLSQGLLLSSIQEYYSFINSIKVS